MHNYITSQIGKSAGEEYLVGQGIKPDNVRIISAKGSGKWVWNMQGKTPGNVEKHLLVALAAKEDGSLRVETFFLLPSEVAQKRKTISYNSTGKNWLTEYQTGMSFTEAQEAGLISQP